MPRILEIAIREAVSKRGVSVVTIPGDVALLPATEAPTAKTSSLLPAAPVVTPAASELAKLAEMLNSGRRITVLCGSGCQGAHDQLIALCERLNAPVVHALRGKEHVEWDNPYDVGMTGLIGFSSGYYAMLDGDVLLMLGTDFPYRQFYPREAGVRIAQVDIRAAHIGRRAPVDLGIVGDVRATLEALLPLLQQNPDAAHLTRARAHYRKARQDLDDLAAPGRRGIHPQQIAKAISDQAADDAVFTCDVGLPIVWASRYLAMNGKRRLIRLEHPDEVGRGIAQALAHDGPVLVDAVVNRSELAMPPAITLEMAKGFSLYMLRAVMNGRTDEVIELARSNLWR